MSRPLAIIKTATWLAVGCLLAGCSSKPVDPGPKEDPTLAQHQRAGELAYSLDRPDEAVAQYQSALAQAEARDDLTAIGNLSFNLVVAQLRANQAAAALATAHQAQAELQRRGSASFPALDLAEATALYRTGDAAQADRAAARLQTGTDADTLASASFLRGLIADERSDGAGLDAAIQALGSAGPGNTGDQQGTALKPDRQADLAELQARLARRQGDFAKARQQALLAADLRRNLFDYRGLARALAVAADAAERGGDAAAAADLYLRAGRSAAAQHDPQQARPWLKQAIHLTADPAIRAASQEALDGLNQPGGSGDGS